ncbi:MAG: discoidin domain-containing protein [Bacteroidota bacterium]|nr:discoidin domain-containing protein [Bacteroidota bacterium]
MKIFLSLSLLFLSFSYSQTSRQSVLLDNCENVSAWTPFQSIGVTVAQQSDAGFSGNGLRFDVNFPKGSGYGGVVRNFQSSLPESYEISFMMKATVPVNNFEIKVSSDSAGENIWWVNNKNYTYPTDWKKIVIKKRHLGFAWGTKPASHPEKFNRLEIIVTAGTGGRGSVWIDDVTLTTVPMPPKQIPQPIVSASSSIAKGKPENILAAKKGSWISKTGKKEWIELDLKYEKEFGAIELSWDKSLTGLNYDILTSYDKKNYEVLYSVKGGISGTVIHFVPESEARYVKIQLSGNDSNIPYKLEEITLASSDSLSTPNQFFERIAKIKPIGFYPRYFLMQQPYWTVVGVPSDTREALFNEDGVFEVDRQRFSIEPFITLDNGKQCLTWANAKTEQSLEENYLPIPTVKRLYENIQMDVTLLANGEAERSAIFARYVVKNISASVQKGSFYLAIRPFQVNPTSQWLNYDGGFAKTESISFEKNKAQVGDKTVYVSDSPTAFGATTIDEGDITEFISRGELPISTSATNKNGMTSGAFQYAFELKSGDSLVVIAAVPFTPEGNHWKEKNPSVEEFAKAFSDVKTFWKDRLNTVQFSVPAEAQKYIDIMRSNLGYILINKDRFGFQPGSRSYERSWIRDGSMTSDALLKLGIIEEPKKYLEWYSSYQYESGAVPCVVDTRGPDPVPEHDSHGELIFACMEYFRFTNDTIFLRARWNNIVTAVNFIQSLRAQRMTPEYRDGNDEKRAFYGLVTESISHEGYSDKAMHSYWDNFFVLKGLKDAASAAAILGRQKETHEYDSLANAFRIDLYKSIALAMKNKNISYIPGCVEKGDFDATSTSIALFPNGEMKFVPQPAFNNTFDKYFDWFVQRAENKISWDTYTPYEIRNVGTFIYLGQKARAHYALEYFMLDQRPQEWNHWAEVVANGYRTQRFIGDMPHTWVGSDYINAIRAMFVYEIDDEHSIVLGAGLKDEWVEEGLSVKNLPTHYGILSYSISDLPKGVTQLNIAGTIDARKNPILIPVSLTSSPLKKAAVNGIEVQSKNGYIVVDTVPATIEMVY